MYNRIFRFLKKLNRANSVSDDIQAKYVLYISSVGRTVWLERKQIFSV